MSYLEDYYSIDDLIIKLKGLDLMHTHLELSKEVERLDLFYKGLNLKDHYKQKSFLKYRDYAGDFLFFLNTGIVPSKIGLVGLRHFLPLIKSLVESGALKKSILNLFDE